MTVCAETSVARLASVTSTDESILELYVKVWPSFGDLSVVVTSLVRLTFVYSTNSSAIFGDTTNNRLWASMVSESDSQELAHS